MFGPTIAERAKYANAEIGFHIGFFESLVESPDEPVMGVSREVPSSTALEEYPWIGDLPGFEEWKQDRSMQGMERKKISISNKDWASGVPIHKNEIADDKLGLAMDRIRGLAGKAKHHRADMLVKYLLNGSRARRSRSSATAWPTTASCSSRPTTRSVRTRRRPRCRRPRSTRRSRPSAISRPTTARTR